MRSLAFLAAFLFAPACGASLTYPFAVDTEREGDGHRIVARNDGPAPVSVRVALEESGGSFTADRPFPVYAVVPPNGGTLHLGRVRPATPGAGYAFGTRAAWIIGDHNAAQSPEALYRLPFRDGEAYYIGQAPGGPLTTHAGRDGAFAVDIPMPQGTVVVAAREGVVVEARSGETEGGERPDLASRSNAVRILHEDGTMATYAHLAAGGVFVHPGQRVSAGSPIGLAGSTGYSSGPHLHFAVLTVEATPEGFEAVSLPFRFYVGARPLPFEPRYGMRAVADYTASAAVPAVDRRLAAAAGRAEPAAESPVRALLLRIPVWQWMAGFVLVVLLVYSRRGRRARGAAARRPAARSTARRRGG